MLTDKDATAVVAVKDMQKAKEFYEDKLGLKKMKDDPSGVFYKSGNTGVFVYESKFAGTNQATAVSWAVGDDLEKIIEELKGKGVTFEHYDMPQVTRKGDIHIFSELKSAWFKDPDGNILNIVNGM
jgi:catechol 2,3-dioxygenase-like lactoylglutathione lyase family enzyme